MKELTEESPLRKELMTEYLAHTAGAGVRFEVEIGVRELFPRRCDFVRFADVGIQKVLEGGVDRVGNCCVGNSGPGVMHGDSFPAACHRRKPCRPWKILVVS